MDTPDPKNPQQAKVRSGLPRRRAESFQTLRDITIPAGTILRHAGEDDFSADIGIGIGGKCELVATIKAGTIALGVLKRVTAA